MFVSSLSTAHTQLFKPATAWPKLLPLFCLGPQLYVLMVWEAAVPHTSDQHVTFRVWLLRSIIMAIPKSYFQIK